MNKLFAVAALTSALAAPALANPETGLFQWQVSADGGTTWSSSITLNPGDPYQIRGLASWTGPASTDPESVGFAGCTFEQIDLIGADASDIFGGASGPDGVPTYLTRRQVLAESWTLQAGTGASATGLKIDQIIPTNRLNFSQLPKRLSLPAGSFSTDNPILVFLLDAVAGDAKTLTISSPWTRLGTPTPTNEFKIYTTFSGTSFKPVAEAVLTDAVINIIPAPATLPALAALTLLRRRR